MPIVDLRLPLIQIGSSRYESGPARVGDSGSPRRRARAKALWRFRAISVLQSLLIRCLSSNLALLDDPRGDMDEAIPARNGQCFRYALVLRQPPRRHLLLDVDGDSE